MKLTLEQSEVLDYFNDIKKRLESNKHDISVYNSSFIKQRKEEYKYLWNTGSFTLDDEQQTAIIVDDKYNLVVAAAGSGKTEVLTIRIAYLIKRKPDYIHPKS